METRKNQDPKLIRWAFRFANRTWEAPEHFDSEAFSTTVTHGR